MAELTTLGAVIKATYENEPDTNAFTDAEKSKLASLGDGAVDSVNGQTGDVVLTHEDVGALPDDYEAPVQSVNGQTGEVVLTHEDVGALPDDYEPPAAPVQSVNGQTGEVSLTAEDVGALTDDYEAPVQSVNGSTGNVILTAMDVGALPDDYEPPVTSVNGSTGNVILTAMDVGALPDSYEAPVQSVNGQTGEVVLTHEDVGALPDDYEPPVTTVNGSTGDVVLTAEDVGALSLDDVQANVPIYASAAAVEEMHIPPGIPMIRTNGYYSPGDGGGATYRRRPNEPNRPGKIQSADGAWWLFYDDVFNIRAFGAKGDGVTDDTAAVQDAIDASVPVRGIVRVPDGVFRITDTLEFAGRVVMEGDTGAGTDTAGSILYQEDPTKPLISMYIRDELRNLHIKVNNTDLENPVQGPPCILVNSGPAVIQNIYFQYPFIGIGSPAGGEGGSVFIQKITGFVHHRMVYLEGTKAISYIDTIHARVPTGAAFLDDTTWAGKHRVLVESHDADGIFGVNWFCFGGRGLYKHSGAGVGPNLMTTVSNSGAEYITHGIEIEAGSVQSQAIHFNGIYLQTNNREDGEYLVSCESDVRLILTGFVANHSKGTDHVRVSAGDVSISNSRFSGHSETNAIRKYPGGKITVSDTVFDRTYRLVHFEDGADNVYLDQSNVISLMDSPVQGQLFNDVNRVNGNNHIFIPVQYLDENLEESTSISEYHPTRDKMVFAKNNIWVHKNSDSDADDTAGFVASNRNNAGQFIPGPRARFRVRSTGSTPGSESSEAYIENYWNGEWDAPLRLGNTFLQSGSDNQRRLGTASNRWSEVFAVAGAINTSDARAKTPLRPLTEGELKVAIALTRLPGVYQWLDSVAEKGADNARLHMGVLAQDVKAAFEAEGLDGFRYGVLCYDEWEDSPDDKMTAGSLYGIRYDELAQWQAAGWNARLEALEGIDD